MRTQDWCAAVSAAHAEGRLTRAARDVLFRLARLRARYRSLWPSHDWLAAAARCCRRTVVRALAQAQAAGLVTWRPQRWLNGHGWRRGTNIYRLQMPPAPVPAPLGHSAPQGKQALEEEAKEEVVLAVVEADGRRWMPDRELAETRQALAAIRQAREAALAARWWAARGQ